MGIEITRSYLSLCCFIVAAKSFSQSGPPTAFLLEFALAAMLRKHFEFALTTSSKQNANQRTQCQSNGNARAAGIPQTYDWFATQCCHKQNNPIHILVNFIRKHYDILRTPVLYNDKDIKPSDPKFAYYSNLDLASQEARHGTFIPTDGVRIIRPKVVISE